MPIAAALLTFCTLSQVAHAGQAPEIAYRVRNDGINTDRFPDPETAARTSIDRFNQRSGSSEGYYIYDHIEPLEYNEAHYWRIYYLHYSIYNQPTTTGPWPYGSAVERFYICDPTPMIGPNYGSDAQGLPKDHSTYAASYPNGCPTPEVDAEKNPCLANCAGNPINLGLAAKVQEEFDYDIGESDRLRFVRRYSSIGYINDARSASRSLGANWRHNYERTVTPSSLGAHHTAAVLRPDGRILKFSLAGGAWVGSADIVETLARELDGGGNPVGWTFTDSQGTVEAYDVNGRLLSINDRSGYAQVLSYSTLSTPLNIAPTSGLLISISDSYGNQLQLAYDAMKRITSVQQPGGSFVVYTYDSNNNLSSVTYPDGAIRAYVYGEIAFTASTSRPNHLTGILDENTVRFATYGYDSYGRAVSTTHAGGAGNTTVSYAINENSNVASATVTDALGMARSHQLQFRLGVSKTASIVQGNVAQSSTYDNIGNTISRVDYNGNRVCSEYDSRNLETVRVEGFTSSINCPATLVTYTPIAGTRQRKISTQWHSSYRLPSQVDEPGKRTTYTHDANGNVLTKTILDTTTSESRTWAYTYNGFGRVLTANGPRIDVSDITTCTYYTCTTGYQCGQVNTITNALGHITTYNTYNAHGQPLTITDPNGVVTTLTYDLRQRLTSRTVGTEQSSFAYWPTGLLKKATLPDGSYIEYTYDAAHRLTGINDAEGNRIAYVLDAMGNRTKEEAFDPSNTLTQTRSRVFDTLNQLWKDIGAAGTAAVTTSFGYDNNGNQTSINAPLSRNTTQAYDELNRLTQVTDPSTGLTQYGYNALDQLIAVTDPRSKVTSYTYNALGDLTQQVSPDTGTTNHTYDSAGNLKTRTDARSKTGTYSYDALNRVSQLSYPDQTITYTYDQGTNAAGRLSSLADASGSTVWLYDAQGRVTSRQQSMGSVSKTVGYGYNSFGQLQGLTLPSGTAISYGYQNGRVTSVTVNGSTVLLNNVLYQPFGQTLGWTWGNATQAVREYDTDGKVTDIDSAGLKTYAYDDAFRITGITDVDNAALSQTYSYDPLDRLTGATGTALNQSWAYDANGNRLTQGGAQPSSYTIATTNNRISSISGSLTRGYGYDAAGNTTGDGTAAYTYDDAGRMVSATKAGVTAAYKLNALGQRVRKTISAAHTYFVYDEAGHLLGEYDNAGSAIQETVWLGDTPVATLRPNGSGGVNVFYVHTDHLNTPRMITRASDNAIVWRWDSDPFGTTVPNQNPSGLGAFAYNLRFPGQYADSETGLNYNYFRDYDPATGRYVQSDPIGLDGGINTYSYVAGNPLSFADPLGLDPKGGERGATGGTGGKNTDNPYKHCREYNPPQRGAVECKHHQTGKWIRKPRPPEMPFPGDKSEMCGDECRDTATTVVVAGGVAYVVYRCVRMVPSLAPPLWPTIPANLVVP